jgi:ubiquitin C-terminal hydrolase
MPFPFKNVGNSCYLGTALHAVLHCPQLTNYFLKNLNEEDANKRKKNASAFVAAYKVLVDAYWNGTDAKHNDDAYDEVRTLFLKQHGKTFQEGQQHDAHEAFMCVLQTLHAGLTKTKKIEGSKASKALEGAQIQAWNAANGNNNYSILTEIFQWQSENRIQTPDGKYQSTTYEHMLDLGVPVCKDVRGGLQPESETIADYVLEDGTRTSITRNQRITYMPLILVMHIKRFTNHNDKINDYVDYPIQFDSYELFGVILHHGTMDTGHYTCMMKHQDAWFMCNDESIDEIKNINHVISSNAYVLLYKKINLS